RQRGAGLAEAGVAALDAVRARLHLTPNRLLCEVALRDAAVRDVAARRPMLRLLPAVQGFPRLCRPPSKWRTAGHERVCCWDKVISMPRCSKTANTCCSRVTA